MSPADKRKNWTRAITVGFIACVSIYFYSGRGGKGSRLPVEEDTPEAAVWRVMDALRGGDPEVYLRCYTDEMESHLRRNLQEMGAARFHEYLLNTHRQVKGIAVSPPQMNEAGEARVAVEYVHADRNEKQQLSLRRVGGEWKVF